jgi:hypothetical protein
MTDDNIHELLIAMEMRYQILGSNLVHFMDIGFDPDLVYTPCEIAMHRVYEHLGFDSRDIVREAHRRLKEEIE